ncbi:MAG: thioredoxin family protein, partial [Streptococcus sp.]|nr:thioredoxin family protein [Streptococcus sp.]
MTTQLTTETFAKSIQNGVSFIDFGAQWCPPCRMMEPVVEELSQDFDGKVTIAQVDVDQSQDLANLFGIRSIPTMVIFKDVHHKPLMFNHAFVKGVFMKPFYVLVLFFTSALCFAETVTIDPTSTTKADDANTIANMYRMGMGVP